MDITSRDAEDFYTALTVFSEEDRQAFHRWSQHRSQFDGINRQILFGHPYYLLTIIVSDVQSNIPFDYINPRHRVIIQNFIKAKETSSLHFEGDLLFFRIRKSLTENGSFVAVFTVKGINAFCRSLPGSTALTDAELRTLVQLLAGIDLKTAAAKDGLSCETKRTHLKTVNSKLGYNRQIDLVAEILSQIMLEVIANDGGGADTSVLSRYLNMYAPREMRLHTLQNGNGEPVNVIDLGPLEGQPIISIQPTIMTQVSDDFVAQLYEPNIRQLAPVRNGVLDPASPMMTYDEYLQAAVDGIDAAGRLSDSDRYTLHSTCSCTAIALTYARAYPKKIANLIFQSALAGATSNFFENQNLTAAICSLASNSPLTLKMILQYLDRYMTDSDKILQLYLKSFAANPFDVAHILHEMKSAEMGGRLDFIMKNSMHALLHDFRLASSPDWNGVANVAAPVYFIHGLDDKICELSKISTLVDQMGKGQIHPVAGTARFLSRPQMIQVTTTISEILTH